MAYHICVGDFMMDKGGVGDVGCAQMDGRASVPIVAFANFSRWTFKLKVEQWTMEPKRDGKLRWHRCKQTIRKRRDVRGGGLKSRLSNVEVNCVSCEVFMMSYLF